MDFRFEGTVIAVLEVKSGVSKSTGNAWMNQEYVVESNEMYPKKMCFSVFGEDKIKQFNIKKGDQIGVHFNIDAREWEGRYFNSISAWKVETLGESQAPAQPQNKQVPPAPQAGTVQPAGGITNDDLPF